jgi:hypothetical protein
VPGLLEQLAYSISRGVTRAYLDVLAERNVAVEERPNDEDRKHADRFRAAVERVRAEGDGGPGP